MSKLIGLLVEPGKDPAVVTIRDTDIKNRKYDYYVRSKPFWKYFGEMESIKIDNGIYVIHSLHHDNSYNELIFNRFIRGTAIFGDFIIVGGKSTIDYDGGFGAGDLKSLPNVQLEIFRELFALGNVPKLMRQFAYSWQNPRKDISKKIYAVARSNSGEVVEKCEIMPFVLDMALKLGSHVVIRQCSDFYVVSREDSIVEADTIGQLSVNSGDCLVVGNSRGAISGLSQNEANFVIEKLRSNSFRTSNNLFKWQHSSESGGLRLYAPITFS